MRDPRTHPMIGDTALIRRKESRVKKVHRHINSPDISYITIVYPSGKERTIVGYEWCVEAKNHKASKQCEMLCCCVCTKTVYVCESLDFEDDDFCGAHLDGVEVGDGHWVCSRECWQSHLSNKQVI